MITKEQKFNGSNTQIKTECTKCLNVRLCKSQSNLWICETCSISLKNKVSSRIKLSNILGLKPELLLDLEQVTAFKLDRIKAVFVPENYTPLILGRYEKFDIFDIQQVTADLKSNDENRLLLGVVFEESNNTKLSIGIFQDKEHSKDSISILYQDNELASHTHEIKLL
jgi:hypothetical protein